MEYDKITKAVEIILDGVLTPVIYMYEHEDWVEFVCFCDGKLTIGDLYATEQKVKCEIDKDVEIVDLREFDQSERLDIISNYKVVHSESDFLEHMIAAGMMTDFQHLLSERHTILERRQQSGTYYLQ